MSMKKRLIALMAAVGIGGATLAATLTGCEANEPEAIVDVAPEVIVDNNELLDEALNPIVDYLDENAKNLGIDAEGKRKLTYRINGVETTFATVTDSAETSSFSLVADAEANAKSTKVLYTFAGTAENFDEIKALESSAEVVETSEKVEDITNYLKQVYSFVTENMENVAVTTNYKTEYEKYDIELKKNDVIVSKVLNSYINAEEGIDRASVQELLDKTSAAEVFANKMCDLGPWIDEATEDQYYRVKLFAEFAGNCFTVDLKIKSDAELSVKEVRSIVVSYLNGENIEYDVNIELGSSTWSKDKHSIVWKKVEAIREAKIQAEIEAAAGV